MRRKEAKKESLVEGTGVKEEVLVGTVSAGALLERWLSDGTTVAPCTPCRPPITVTNLYKAIGDEDRMP